MLLHDLLEGLDLEGVDVVEIRGDPAIEVRGLRKEIGVEEKASPPGGTVTVSSFSTCDQVAPPSVVAHSTISSPLSKTRGLGLKFKTSLVMDVPPAGSIAMVGGPA